MNVETSNLRHWIIASRINDHSVLTMLVEFVKADGSTREMHCRLGVKEDAKYLSPHAALDIIATGDLERVAVVSVTVFCIDCYEKEIKSGKNDVEAGRNSWRQIRFESLKSVMYKEIYTAAVANG